MAASSKIDLPSGSPDRLFCSSTQRESFTTSSMERSSSFREGSENPVLSTLPNMARTSSAVVTGEIMNFIQNLHFDMKSVSGDNRCQRLMCSLFGVQLDDSVSDSMIGKFLPSSSWEELKRAKGSVREGIIRARERLKVFHSAVSVFNKYLTITHSRKRSRSEVLSTERSASLSSGDRLLLGPNAGKRVGQGNAVSNVLAHEQQKPEGKTKNAFTNKRTRTSLTDIRMDVRNNSFARPLESTERNRATPRLAATGVTSGDIMPSVSVDGWEKTSMKKKRSGIKADGSSSTVSTTNDGCREIKLGIQQRPVPDVRSRLQGSQVFRPGMANGAAKGDVSQQSGITVGSSVPKADQDNGSLDRRERSVSTDKERMNFKAVNKPGSRDDFSSASPTSSSKLNPSARAPRSFSVSAPKSAPMINRVATFNDWELTNCSNKLHVPSGTNGKHNFSTRSSSPPAHRAGQRSQKNSRPTRKASFLSVSPGNDDVSPLEFMSDVAGTENGSGFTKRAFGDSPKQMRLKGDHFSSTYLSESEDSANGEIKFIDKKSEKQNEKPGNHAQKLSTLVPSVRKNKLANEEESGDVIRGQGRMVRGVTSSRSLIPMNIDKLANVGTAKQLRTVKLGLDKSESKAGRPPSRKLSDRKAYTRQKHSGVNSATDFLVGLDDCNEELVAAASAVINPCYALSSAFWKEVETYFRLISDNDIAFLKQQENQGSFLLSPNAVELDYVTIPNGCNKNQSVGFTNDIKYAELGTDPSALPMRLKSDITLYQRLLAALIPEEERENLVSDSEDLIYDTGLELDEGFGSNTLNQHRLESFQLDSCTKMDGHSKTSSRRPPDSPGHYMALSPVPPTSAGTFSSYGHLENGILGSKEMTDFLERSEPERDNMPLDRKILLEIEGARLLPEGLLDITPLEDDEIVADINCLSDKYYRQVVKKENLIRDLLKLSTKAKETQEKDFESRALDQLVGMSYGKYVAARSLKSSTTSKVVKQAALAFAKRTIERCHIYEDTGTSCFSDPSFLNKFLSVSSFNEAQSADTATESDSARLYDIISNGALEVRASASIGSQQSPSLTSWSAQNLDIVDIYSSDLTRSGNHPSELTANKNDAWLNSREKKRELLLDEVGRSGIGNTLSSSTKGKRSERDREGKGHGRDVISRHGTAKTGRPLMSNAKGERKPKSKPKQRTAQLSASVNDLIGKLPEQPKICMSKSGAATSNDLMNEKDNFAFHELDETDPIDLSGLQLPGMDVLGVSDDLDGQGQDIESWLNIEDDGLQDLDLMGLEIPMDDLSELNMMV
uniref:Uncharacterized protein n=1 Tax=Kalanchoe fedtschenkoi TaxID=63787 RepID=A0A7N0TUH8_KALFE